MILTNSAYQTWQLCQRRYYWSYEKRLKPDEHSFVLDVGTFVHEGLDHIVADGLYEDVKDEAKFEVLHADRIEEGQEEALEFSRWMLERYYEYYVDKEPDWNDVVETEQTICLDWNENLQLAGKIDGLVEYDGKLWILEHKTTYSIDQDYLDKVQLDGQITWYMLLCREVFGETPDGVIYNIVCRPRKYRRKGEPVSSYLDRCKEEWRVTPSAYMARQRAFRDESALDEKIEDIERTYEDRMLARERDYYTKNDGICFLRQRKCPYTRLCKSGLGPNTLMGFKQTEAHPELNLGEAVP